jgi:hypothetical protein
MTGSNSITRLRAKLGTLPPRLSDACAANSIPKANHATVVASIKEFASSPVDSDSVSNTFAFEGAAVSLATQTSGAFVSDLRESLLLESSEETKTRNIKLQIAKELVSMIKEEANGLHDARVRNRKVPVFEPGMQRTSSDRFIKFLKLVALKNGISDLDIDNEITALCAYYSLRVHDESERTDQFLGFEKFPDNFFDQDKETKLRILAKHYFIDLKGYKTAKDIEGIVGLADSLQAYYLPILIHQSDNSAPALISNTFAELTDGDYPFIRPWLIRGKDMWQNHEGEELASRAVRYTLKFVAGVIDANERIDVDAIKHISRHGGWEAVLGDKRNPLEGLLTITPRRSVRQIILLGLPEFKGSKIAELSLKIGEEHERISNEDMDMITSELVRANCSDADGEITNAGILNETRWSTRFSEVDKRIFEKSNFRNAYEALVHKYPERFGWKSDQIHPGDISFGNMWEGNDGERLFREYFAYILSTLEIGKLDTHETPGIYTVTQREFEEWMERNSQDPIKYIIENKIRFPGFKDVCGRNVALAYRKLFDMNPDFGNVEKKFQRQLITKLFEENGGTLQVIFDPVSAYDDCTAFPVVPPDEVDGFLLAIMSQERLEALERRIQEEERQEDLELERSVEEWRARLQASPFLQALYRDV